MDTLQINHALRHWRPLFRGTYAINHLPIVYTQDPPFGLVMNLDAYPSGGTHWVAFYSSGPGKLEYFDTAGEPPPDEEKFKLIFTQFDVVTFNHKRIQGSCSSVCGEYCVLFLSSRFESIPFPDFSSTDFLRNDDVVYNVIHKHFDIVKRKRPFPVVDQQCIQLSKQLSR